VDAVGRHTSRRQLIAGGRPPVEEPAIRSRLSIANGGNRGIVGHRCRPIPEPIREQQPIEAGRGESLTNIRTDLVAAGTHTRAESHDEVADPRSAFSNESLDGHLRRTRR
jgi:hypothetical protein